MPRTFFCAGKATHDVGVAKVTIKLIEDVAGVINIDPVGSTKRALTVGTRDRATIAIAAEAGKATFIRFGLTGPTKSLAASLGITGSKNTRASSSRIVLAT
jgi:hypothetical protein